MNLVEKKMRKNVRLLTLALLLSLLIGWQREVDAEEADARKLEAITAVAFGDSSTSGFETGPPPYPTVLEVALRVRGIPARVFNAGVQGDTIRGATSRLDTDVLAQKPMLVIVQFGLNDAAIDLHLGKTEPRVPLAEYRTLMIALLDRIEATGARLVLMTPNPVMWTDNIAKRVGRPPYNPSRRWGYNVIVQRYVAVIRELASNRQIPLVDIYATFKEFDRTTGNRIEELLADGVHPNARGNELIAKTLLPVVAPLLQ
jgi:lysophospholipase L1-like esterase